MKKIYFLILLSAWCLSAFCHGDDSDYTPLVREGSEWVYFSPSGTVAYKYILTGDSTVNGVKYKKMMRVGHHSMLDENFVSHSPYPYPYNYQMTTHCLLREENKRVYGRQVDWWYDNINKLSGEYYNAETEEAHLYDFNDVDKFYHEWMEYFGDHTDKQIVYEKTEPCLLVDRKCYAVQWAPRHSIIEGIGEYDSKYSDVVHLSWRLSGAALGCYLVSFKNGEGEYEYFDANLYNEMIRVQHDPNRDGKVDVSDLTVVINQILEHPQDKCCYLYGSITEDNDFNTSDVTSVINYILGEIKSPLDSK